MAIPIPITRTKIATVPWGIPLTNEVNRLTTATATTAWANLTLVNGWTNASYVAQWRRLGQQISLTGSVSGGSAGLAFTIPVTGLKQGPIGLAAWNGTAYHVASAIVFPDGRFEIWGVGGAGSFAILSCIVNLA